MHTFGSVVTRTARRHRCSRRYIQVDAAALLRVLGLGRIDIFPLNSNDWEPHGIGPGCKQAMWLQSTLSASTAPWKIVPSTEAPYSNHCGGQEPHMRGCSATGARRS